MKLIRHEGQTYLKLSYAIQHTIDTMQLYDKVLIKQIICFKILQ